MCKNLHKIIDHEMLALPKAPIYDCECTHQIVSFFPPNSLLSIRLIRFILFHTRSSSTIPFSLISISHSQKYLIFPPTLHFFLISLSYIHSFPVNCFLPILPPAACLPSRCSLSVASLPASSLGEVGSLTTDGGLFFISMATLEAKRALLGESVSSLAVKSVRVFMFRPPASSTTNATVSLRVLLGDRAPEGPTASSS